MNVPTPVSLDQFQAGRHAVVRQVRGGQELVNRCASMGLTADAQLLVLQNTGHGPMLVSVRDTRIALGRGEAAKILVEALAP